MTALDTVWKGENAAKCVNMFKLKLFCITDIVYVPNVTQMVQYIVIKNKLYFAPGAGTQMVQYIVMKNNNCILHLGLVLCASTLHQCFAVVFWVFGLSDIYVEKFLHTSKL